VVTHWEFSQYLPEALADRRLVPAGPLDRRMPSWQERHPGGADQVVVDKKPVMSSATTYRSAARRDAALPTGHPPIERPGGYEPPIGQRLG